MFLKINNKSFYSAKFAQLLTDGAEVRTTQTGESQQSVWPALYQIKKTFRRKLFQVMILTNNGSIDP